MTSLLEGRYAYEWERLVPSLRAPSPRATTSSRTPGKVNTGTVWFAVMQIEACASCGRLMGNFPGAHAPRHSPTDPLLVIDCVGRPCVKGGDGYYRVAG